MEQVLIDLLKERPDFLLVGILLCVMIVTVVVILPIAMVAQIIWGQQNVVLQLLNNPVIQERMKDTQLNFSEFMEQMIKSANESASATPRRIGIFAKMNQDVTWDVSGIIGLIVTVVLMIMVVSRTYNDMPREILAGWTTILGFYFGKASIHPEAKQNVPSAPQSHLPPSQG
jgi:predicted PurR-regulated permease PerM